MSITYIQHHKLYNTKGKHIYPKGQTGLQQYICYAIIYLFFYFLFIFNVRNKTLQTAKII